MSKAYSVMHVKSFSEDNDERTIHGIASTPSLDRDNDRIDAQGVKFALPIPLLWQHNHNQPIGEVIDAKITEKGVEFTAKIAKIEEKGPLKDRIDEAWQSVKSGLVKCVSVGFRALDYDYLKDTQGLHIKAWEWYELSVVTIPANPDAVITNVKQIKDAFAEAQSHPEPSKSATATIAPKDTTKTTVEAVSAPVTLLEVNPGSIQLIME